MQWEQTVYQVTVQPNRELDLNQVGVIRQNVLMKDETVAGAIWMAEILFGSSRSQHIRIDAWTGQRATLYRLYGKNVGVIDDLYSIQPSTFPIFLRNWVPFVLDPAPDEIWSDYLATLESALGHTINEGIMPYNCRMVNQEKNWSAIFQFMTRNFLEGAILCLSWFGLPSEPYLDNIYLTDQPLTVEEVGSLS
jgi:hypothetical protein